MSTESPDITEMRERIAALPEAWVTDLFARSVIVQLQAGAALRVLDERIVEATARRTEAINALADPTDDAVRTAIAAEAEATALISIRGRIPAPNLAEIASAEPLRRASEALTQQLRTDLEIPSLHYDAEMAAWRTACAQLQAPLDPPLPTDLDRTASARVAELTASRDSLHLSHRSWTANQMSGVAHPVDLLASAAAMCAAITELREQLAAATKDIAEANRARHDVGLNWRADRAAAALLTSR